jgi:hypothetical protein
MGVHMVSGERRRAPRRRPYASEPLSRMRVRAGRELDVVNISSTGALVEGEARLLPGRHVDVHVISSSGRMLARSRVVRAFVSVLASDRVLYRGALAFEQPVQLGPAPADSPRSHADYAGNNFPRNDSSPSPGEGSDYPEPDNEWQATCESTRSGAIEEEA